MITPGIETQNATRKVPRQHPGPEAKRVAVGHVRKQAPAPSASGFTESARFALRDDLDSVRREHARLQQAIYEAAQIQRRLCAPRELVWGEFGNRRRGFSRCAICRGIFSR